MISQEQAHIISDEILRQQHQLSLEAKNLAAKKIFVLYRCAELNCLQAVERVMVVDEAKRAMRQGHWLAVVALLLWIAVFAGVWLFVITPAQRSQLFFVCLFLLYTPPIILYLSTIRLHIKYLARLRLHHR